MSKYIILIKANIKKQKGTALGIFILMFLISVSFCAVMALWNNANQYEHEELTRLGYGDITQWVANVPDEAALLDQINSLDIVDHVEDQSVIFVSGLRDDSVMLLAYQPDLYNYHILRQDMFGFQTKRPQLKNNEILIPAALSSEMHLKIGDHLEINQETYIVKGYFEDPIMGSSVMGVKSILMNANQHERLFQSLKNTSSQTIRTGYALHLFQKDHKATTNEFQKILNEHTDLKKYTTMSYSFSTIEGFMLILHDMFSGFLMLFVMLLLIIAMLMLGHSISSSIDQDYMDLGILKAVGFSNQRLRSTFITQYLLIVCLGVLLGMLSSSFFVRLINQLTVTVTGLYVPSNLPLGLCMAFMMVMIAILTIFIYIKTKRLLKVTPLRAIRGGGGDVYFQSRLTTPILHHHLNFTMALRQLIFHKKLYISACIVSTLLVFFLSFTARFSSWVGPNGEGITTSFAAAPADIEIKSDDTTMKKVKQNINSWTPVDKTYEFVNVKGEVNHVNYILNIISDPLLYKIIKGQTCHYENEIVLTEFVAKDLNVTIGDTVRVGYEGHEADFVISGINQCANDMGANFSMSTSGFQRLSKQMPAMYTCFILKDASYKKEVKQQLQATFNDQIEISDDTWAGVDDVISVMSVLQIVMYILVICFIFVVVILTGSKILNQEQHDLGIYKSLGYASGSLRRAFAIRFGTVAALGSFLGMLLSVLYSDKIAAFFLQYMGISVYQTHQNILQIIEPGVIVVMIFIIFAFYNAKKIKKVEPVILIRE